MTTACNSERAEAHLLVSTTEVNYDWDGFITCREDWERPLGLTAAVAGPELDTGAEGDASHADAPVSAGWTAPAVPAWPQGGFTAVSGH